METGLYYCRSRYYDPAIRRFISADDTQVLRDNLDMLGEKKLYAYCDDNPIMRVDVNGQFSLICGLIGATMNVLAGGVAAAVTGQEYIVGDMVAAEGLEKTIAITWGATYGVGAEGIAASVSRGLSVETSETKMQVKNVLHEKKVGQSYYYSSN